jgi:hypothetical protein
MCYIEQSYVYTSTPPYIFMVWWVIKHRHIFSFTLRNIHGNGVHVVITSVGQVLFEVCCHLGCDAM